MPGLFMETLPDHGIAAPGCQSPPGRAVAVAAGCSHLSIAAAAHWKRCQFASLRALRIDLDFSGMLYSPLIGKLSKQ
jgi:hypothetical protein